MNGKVGLKKAPLDISGHLRLQLPMTAPAASGAGLMGRIAVHYKLITPEQATEALRVAGRGGNTKKLGEILLELGYITAAQLKWLVDAQQKYLAKQATGSEAPAPAPIPAPAARQVAEPVAEVPTPSARQSPRGEARALDRILTEAVQARASDVHIHAGAAVQMRTGGKLMALKAGSLDAAATERMILEILTPEQRERLIAQKDLDLAYSLPGVGRFRANFYHQQRGWDAVFRPIPTTPPTLEQLGLPSSLAKLTTYHQGLVLLTGPAGCGKSSTLAALVDLINEERSEHIITVEDPIEFVHPKKKCLVNQRQVGGHTASFASALRAALREDPDVIVIGELRDMETISLAITAAETGHLVLGTLHTNNSIRTINRILDVFPPKQQSQVRAMVSESLRAVVSQRLVPAADGKRRVPALEILFVKPAISNLIRDSKTFQIRSILQTARGEGMCLLDDSLAELVKSGTITREVARKTTDDPKAFL